MSNRTEITTSSRLPAVGRSWIRASDGAANLRLLLIAGMSTVLVTRLYLAAAGYPQVGNGTLHIAHALWGGLLLLAGLIIALALAGSSSRRAAALAGGVGVGLFVDEVGKFITQANDYFFRPAAAVIYLLFAGLVCLTVVAGAPRATTAQTRRATAATIAADGLAAGLTPARRAQALELLAGDENTAARSVRALIDAAPDRAARTFPRLRRVAAAARRLIGQTWFRGTVIALFVFSRIMIGVVYLSETLPLLWASAEPGRDSGMMVASTVTRIAEMVLVLVGAVCMRYHRSAAMLLFKAALLVNLALTQLLNFTDSQFAAIAELPFLILVVVVLATDTNSASSSGRVRAGEPIHRRPVG